MNRLAFAAAAVATLLSCPIPAFSATEADDGERAEVRRVTENLMARFFDARPRLKPETRAAAGYAVFTTYSANLMGEGGGGGRGVGLAVDNRTGRDTFMGLTLDKAGKEKAPDREILIVFSSAESLAAFAKRGWNVTTSAPEIPGTKVYAISRTTVEADVPLAGTRFWINDVLN